MCIVCACVCLQMLQRVVMVAAESLKELERQLMDAGQIQDVRVSKTIESPHRSFS